MSALIIGKMCQFYNSHNTTSIYIKSTVHVYAILKCKFQYPTHPLAIYQVSGEYAMLYHGAKAGAFDLKTTLMEVLASMRRAGNYKTAS